MLFKKCGNNFKMIKNPFTKNSLVTKYQKLINQINCLETNLKILNDDELRVKTLNLQKQHETTSNSNSLIAESFALTREASSRSLGLRHFDVQLLGGLVLNSGKIAEMKTGEGKTLVATLPAVLNALKKKGVHIVTVNDYLANRDQVSMGQIYRFLGLNTGLIQEGMSNLERKENYNADITYVTNYELVFDFLRDNMVSNIENVVLKPFNYCVIDEVDSILIDEAQTPLIIADPIETSNIKYVTAAEITNYLEANIHFKIDLEECDSARFMAVNPNIEATQGQKGVSMVNSIVEDVRGDLQIDYPYNKSGQLQDSFPQYPIFKTNQNSYVRYNKRNLQGNVYNPDLVYFRLDPFEVDSLGYFSNSGIRFSGSFKSGGIFPEFDEDLVLMPNHSLGFVKQTPPEGFPVFDGKGVFKNKIMLSNDGIIAAGSPLSFARRGDIITIDNKNQTINLYIDSEKKYVETVKLKESIAEEYKKAYIRQRNLKWGGFAVGALGIIFAIIK